ncbi:MAG: methyltransferase [Deltaproteobacteria bacterium]|uniref:Methyltransferase n=1 Tax=Candidatus Zymogenus saltonus TaxID=2844893 RepID=A0A9D8KJV4_9DELT|nr:methyltransferase [Candidatus Zymogenus saltonus]
MSIGAEIEEERLGGLVLVCFEKEKVRIISEIGEREGGELVLGHFRAATMSIGFEIGERGRSPLVVDQPEGGYRYSMDPFLLVSFVRLKRGEKVIDFGSGVGVIGIVLAALYPDANITGIEIQRELHEASLRNIEINDLLNRVNSRLGDFRRIGDYFRPSSFTAAVSNPPYYREDDCRVSGKMGVAAAKHGITGGIKEIIDESSLVLKAGGSLSIIYPAEKYQYLETLLNDGGFSIKRVRFVKSMERLEARTVMLEAVLGVTAQTEVTAPLVVHDEDGGYTNEVGKIFTRIGIESP